MKSDRAFLDHEGTINSLWLWNEVNNGAAYIFSDISRRDIVVNACKNKSINKFIKEYNDIINKKK